jgi:hypothetical protein
LDVITTTIERRWLAEIVAGTKRVAYKEIRPYWTNRRRKVRTPFGLVLRNGIDRVTPNPGGAHSRGRMRSTSRAS